MLSIHHDQRHGIFGRLTNFDANIEAAQKGTLHFHALVTGVISPALLGAVAHSPVLMDTISAVFDSMIVASLPPDRLLEHVVAEKYKTQPEVPRPDYTSRMPTYDISDLGQPCDHSDDKQKEKDAAIAAAMCDLELHSNAAAASTRTVMHFLNHCDACVRCGKRCCRYAKPSGLVECTGMSMVRLGEEFEDHPDPRTLHFDVEPPVERPKHDYARDPIEPLDSRPLAFEMKRPAIQVQPAFPDGRAGSGNNFDILDSLDDPQFAGVDQAIKDKLRSLNRTQRDVIRDLLFSANGLVSEFNHVLMCVANCNMAVYPMGSAASAKAQFMYTCKYVCKNPAEILSLLSILHDAAIHIEKHPSTADDSGTEDRTTRHYVQRILNKLCGKQEYCANQVVAALMGLPAEFQMHKSSQIFADAAARYVAEINHPTTSDDMSSDSENEPSDTTVHQPKDTESDSEASETDSDNSESSHLNSRGHARTLQRETPLLDLIPSNLTEDDEFGPLPEESGSDSSSDLEHESGLDSSSDLERCSDSEEVNDSKFEQSVRQHEPSDTFTELMDSNQTHTGSVQIMSFAENGTPRISLQHHDYRFRPAECSIYSLFEFGQTMRTVEKGKAKEQVSGKNLKNAGKKPAARFEFKDGHPLRTTHECQIMAQHTVPNIVRRIPTYPGPRPNKLTTAWKSAARLFAYHIMLLYKPWEGPEGIPPATALTWKAMHLWLNELRSAPADDIVCRTRLQFVTIAAHGLKICQQPTRLTTDYRYRAATRFDEMAESDRPTACSQQHLDEAGIRANHTAEEGMLSIERLLEKASAAFDDKSVQMQNSTVEFLAQAFPVPAGLNAPVSPLDQTSTPQQCLDLVGAGAFTADTVRKVQSSITARPSDLPEDAAPVKPAREKAASRASSKKAPGAPPPSQIPNFQWSVQQQQIIATFEKYCRAVSAWRALPNPDPRDLPAPPHMMIQGGPGSGKSEVTRKLTQLAADYKLCSVSSAMTAVAALCMKNATTTHSAYHIAVDRNKRKKATGPRNKDLQGLSQSQTRIFSSKVKRALDDNTPVITFIDEVSLMTAITLGHVIQRYREIEGLIIGPFILVGDFYQIAPVGGTPIYSTMMNCDHKRFDSDHANYNYNTSKTNQLRPESRGIALLKLVQLYPLDSQERSLHAKHTANIKQLSTRDPSVLPVTEKLINCYPPISPEEIASDPLWYHAPIVVANNKIRSKINQQRIIAHAKNNGLPVLFWRNPLAGDNAKQLSEAEIQAIYSTHLALTSYFVVGVICSITENLSQHRGIVNGAQCVMHSLTPDPAEDAERAKRLRPDNTPMPPLHECIRAAKPGEMIELVLPPVSVNVTLSSEEHKNSFSASDTLVQGQLVIPMFLSHYTQHEALKPWELLHRHRDPFKSISFLTHSLEPRYAVTYHKMQGQTVTRLIIDLNKWPHGRLTHSQLLVGLTRVRDMAHCRTLPLLPGQNRKHLYKMRANPEMLAFLCGFNTSDGKWSHEQAHQALEKSGNATSSKPKPPAAKERTAAQQATTSTDPTSFPQQAASKPNSSSGPPKARAAQSNARPPRRPQQSREFSIASQGRIANMQHFRGRFKSFENDGNGNCLFESFRQTLHLTDPILKMRRDMVHRLQQAPNATRISQLNEHIMREIEASNEAYMGWGMSGNDGLDEHSARITIISEKFSDIWQQYANDMQNNAAYAGGAEAAALADMYGVNVTVWRHNERNGIATHLTTYLQTPPAPRTVHLLSIGNAHYEATSLPEAHYPVVSDPSSRAPQSTRSSQALQSSHSGNPAPSVPVTVIAAPNVNASELVAESVSLSDHAAESGLVSASAIGLVADPSLIPASEIVPTSELPPPEVLRPNIEEYCGLVLNDEKYFHAILDGVKIYEVRVVSRINLPPRIIFHPNKTVQASGYTQNIEAMVHPFEHERPLTNAGELLGATASGKHLGMTEEETREFVAQAKKKNKMAVFYLYKLSEPKKSQIEWIDSRTCNQNLFSKHQHTKNNALVTLFRWPILPITIPQVFHLN